MDGRKFLLDWYATCDDYMLELLGKSKQPAVHNWAYYSLSSEYGGLEEKKKLKKKLESSVGDATFAELLAESN